MNKVSIAAKNLSILSPLRELQRTAILSSNQDALIYGKRHLTWQDLYQRCCCFASQLQQLKHSNPIVVSTLLPNVPAFFEAHFAVAMVGGILHPLATDLDAAELAAQLQHQHTQVLLVDPEFSDVAQAALSLIEHEIFVIDVDDEHYELCFKAPIGQIEYEDWLADGQIDYAWQLPQNELQVLYVNHQTPNQPSIYSHRDAYLQGISHFIHHEIRNHSCVLSTLTSQQNCGLIWSMVLHGGSYICLREMNAEAIWTTLHRYHIDYLHTDSATLNLLATTDAIHKSPLLVPVKVLSASNDLSNAAQQHLAYYGLQFDAFD